MRSTLLGVLVPISTAVAQTTWIVDIDNRPGAHFQDLPAAVAAASAGDVLQVRPSATMLGYSAFTTGKGLTIHGGGAFLATQQAPVQLNGLPANQTFRLAGFTAPRGAALRLQLSNCFGVVQLEDLHATEFGFFFPTLPSIHVQNCAMVAMHDVEDFGAPAVQIDNSTAVLTRCRLGITSLGIGGGQCLAGNNATIDVVEPRFDASQGGPIAAIAVSGCVLRVGGSNASCVQGSAAASAPASPAVQVIGGSTVIDPAVRLNPFTAGPPTGGLGVVTFASVPTVSVTGDRPGSTLSIAHTANAGDGVIALLSLPALPLATPVGPLLLDPGFAVITMVATVGAAGTLAQTMPVPAGLPRGVGLAVQDLVLAGGGLALGTGCQFVVH